MSITSVLLNDFYIKNKLVIDREDCIVNKFMATFILAKGKEFSMDENDNIDWFNPVEGEIYPSQEEIQEAYNMLKLLRPIYLLRKKRNELLKETDIYVSLNDFPITETLKEQLLIYRQQLRDLPQLVLDNVDIETLDETNIYEYFPIRPL